MQPEHIHKLNKSSKSLNKLPIFRKLVQLLIILYTA